MTRAAPCLAPLLAALLVGCASSREYPSLARRPAERVTGTAVPVTPQAAPEAVPAAPSTDLSGRLDQLLAAARGSRQSFAARRAAAERAVAGAGSLGSESWATASVALAGLEATHNAAAAALAELDEMMSERRIALAGETDATTAAIDAARSEVTQIVDAEDDVLGRLRARLSG